MSRVRLVCSDLFKFTDITEPLFLLSLWVLRSIISEGSRHLLIDFSINYLTFLRVQRKSALLELLSLLCATHIVHRRGLYPFIALVTFGLSQIVSSVYVFRAPLTMPSKSAYSMRSREWSLPKSWLAFLLNIVNLCLNYNRKFRLMSSDSRLP